MKKLISIVCASMFLSNFAVAECDYSKIQKVDGGYLYTKELHLCVGEMKQDLGIAQTQNEKYLKALSLKDMALDKANERADLWMETSFKLDDKIQTIDRLQSTNKAIYYGLGILTMFAATYAASQLK